MPSEHKYTPLSHFQETDSPRTCTTGHPCSQHSCRGSRKGHSRPDVPSRIVDAGVKSAKGDPGTPAVAATILREGVVKLEDMDIPPLDSADHPKGPFFEDNVNSGIYPYNAYRHPFSHLKRPSDMDPQLFATRLQRLVIPIIMPAGLDAHQIINERGRFIDARIQQRILAFNSVSSHSTAYP